MALGTCRYTHYRSRGGEAARLAPAFQTADLEAELQLSEVPEPATAFQTVPPSRGGNACSDGAFVEPCGSRVNA